MMDKVLMVIQYLLDHKEFTIPILITILEFVGRKIPTVKRASFFSTIGKTLDALSSLWILGPLSKIFTSLSKLCYMISDKLSAVVPDKLK